MTQDRPKLPVAPAHARYEVGYGKPPAETRFRPGQSGNPRGRPRGSKNKRPRLNEERLKEIILDEAYREISVRDGARNVTVPMAQAIVRALAVNAAKGQHRAQRLFAEMLATTERQNRALADQWLETAIEYKASWERELWRREVMEITHLPPPLPHPDQVKVDMSTGEAWIEGPVTKDEIAELETWTTRRDDVAAELVWLRGERLSATGRDAQKKLDADIALNEKVLATLETLVSRMGG